jgi:hypothetical protein
VSTVRAGLACLVVALLATSCASTSSSERPRSTPTKPPSTATSTASTSTAPLGASGPQPASSFGVQHQPCSYVVVGGEAALPDPACTPGATNPAVTQSTIGSTICRSGYSSSVRPAESITYPEKRAAMAAYGAPGSSSAYEYDHLVSLEIGGAPNAAADLWPEPLLGTYGAHVKDWLENKLHDLVCSGSVGLADAQRAEAGSWIDAYRRWVGPLP